VRRLRLKLSSDLEIISLDEPAEQLLVHAALRTYIPPESTLTSGEESLKDFLTSLATIPEGEAGILRETISKRYKLIKGYVQPFVDKLSSHGYKSIGNLIPCPMEMFGVPPSLAAIVRAMLERQLGKNPHLIVQSQRFDRKYNKSATDPTTSRSAVSSVSSSSSKASDAGPISGRAQDTRTTATPILPPLIDGSNKFSALTTKYNPQYVSTTKVTKDNIIVEATGDMKSIIEKSISVGDSSTTRYYCTHPGCKDNFARKYTLLIHMKTHDFAGEYYFHKNNRTDNILRSIEGGQV
jgi:hypothetical protein